MRQLIGLVRTLGLALTLTATAQATPSLLMPYVFGSSVYSVRDFDSEISRAVGKVASAAALETLRAAISEHYVRDGYISPIITMPQEDVGSATPRLYIHEPRVSEIVIKGDAGPYHDLITSYLQPLQSRALQKSSLRQALLHIRELPGITSRPLFDPRPEFPNEFVLVINLGYKPVGVELDANNAGTRDLGRVLYVGSLFLNGVLGAGEQIQLRGATSSLADRYQYEDLKALRWFGATEGFLEGTGSEAVPNSETHFSDRNLTLGLSRALVDIGANSLELLGTLHGDNSEIHDALSAHLVADRVRSLSIGLQFQRTGSLTQTSVYSTVDRAGNVLGATSLDTRDSEVEIAFTKYLFGVTQSVSFNSLWRARFNMDAQITPDVLPLTERFAFGGLGLGEAFDPASLVGDSGTTVTAELGRALQADFISLQSATLYARADYGIAWNNASYLPRKDDAASMSVGVLGRWSHFTSTVEVSAPVLQPTYTQPASSFRALFSASLAF